MPESTEGVSDPITITDPNMTRFLMNLDEAVDLVMFAFQHGNPGDLFIQKSDASTIGDLAKAVQQLFGDTGTNIIGTRHGEKLFETLMTREERLRSEDMGHYFRVAADNRDLKSERVMTTPLFMLRCVQLGISIADLDLLTIGLVNDMFTERQNDEYPYQELASQADFDRF